MHTTGVAPPVLRWSVQEVGVVRCGHNMHNFCTVFVH